MNYVVRRPTVLFLLLIDEQRHYNFWSCNGHIINDVKTECANLQQLFISDHTKYGRAVLVLRM